MSHRIFLQVMYLSRPGLSILCFSSCIGSGQGVASGFCIVVCMYWDCSWWGYLAKSMAVWSGSQSEAGVYRCL